MSLIVMWVEVGVLVVLLALLRPRSSESLLCESLCEVRDPRRPVNSRDLFLLIHVAPRPCFATVCRGWYMFSLVFASPDEDLEDVELAL